MEELSSTCKKSTATRGNTVRQVMPALQDTFPLVRTAIHDCGHAADFQNTYYFLESKGGHFKKLFPAAMYYIEAFRSISEKLYSVDRDVLHIKRLLDSVNQKFKSEKEILPRTGQSSINFEDEIYELKTHTAAFLFNARSLLDTTATLMHFIYGAAGQQFSSFADYAKFICKDEKETGELYDATMKEFIEKDMNWFFLLRDIRDYITHYASIDISLWESDGRVRVYILDKFELGQLVELVSEGIRRFLSFSDGHFSNVIATPKP